MYVVRVADCSCCSCIPTTSTYFFSQALADDINAYQLFTMILWLYMRLNIGPRRFMVFIKPILFFEWQSSCFAIVLSLMLVSMLPELQIDLAHRYETSVLGSSLYSQCPFHHTRSPGDMPEVSPDTSTSRAILKQMLVCRITTNKNNPDFFCIEK